MGLMSKYVIEVYALSGVVVRANDFRKDLRLVGYSYYSRIEFNVVVGMNPCLQLVIFSLLTMDYDGIDGLNLHYSTSENPIQGSSIRILGILSLIFYR